jgi:transposase-like protein
MAYFEATEIVCKHCGSPDIVKYGKFGDTQYFYCKNCNRKITALDTLPKMQTPIKVVASAVSMYYDGLSQNDIRKQLKQIYNRDVSDFAIYNWIERFTKDAVNITNQYRPNVGYVWLADETVINVGGNDYWLLDVIDVKTRFLIASRLSPTRRVEDVQEVLKEAYARTGRIPKVIMTDHLWAYNYGIKMTFGDESKHLQVKKFTAKPNNNIIERMQGTIKERTKVMRDLKSPNTAQLILDGFLINYNYFRQHETLGTTPANKAQAQFPYDNWEGLIKHSQEAQKPALQPHYERPIPPLPYVRLTAKEQKQWDSRMHKRRVLETKRTGIVHKPKSKGGGRQPPRPSIQSISTLRSYK